MKTTKLLVILALFCLLFLNGITAQEETPREIEINVYYFWGEGCSNCEKVKNSEILEKIEEETKIKIQSLEVYYNQENREKYNYFANALNINQYQRGVPFLVIDCNGEYFSLTGSTQIIEKTKEKIEQCINGEIENSTNETQKKDLNKITLGTIIVASIIDSVNPCAFGVLIFLLATMLSIGSSKRALKYGLIYCFVIFLVYFSAGLGIIKILTSFNNIINYFILIAGILVFLGGIIEIKDFFYYGKGFTLKIPDKVKPTLEKITKKGTFGAILLLGILVAIVELPCTGGIYLAILSMMTLNQVIAIPYLALYNFIFILPLLITVFITYYGTKTEKTQTWIENNKKFMRLAAGIIMVGLAIYLLNTSISSLI
jgi:cytochrome c biogenesis protein CcdA